MERTRISIGGVLFDNVNLQEASHMVLDEIKNYQEGTPARFLLVANQDIINKIGNYKDLEVNDCNDTFLTIPDGYSIIVGAKYLGTPLKERVTGPDLMKHIISLASSNNIKHFFLGAAEGVAQKMVDNFKKEFPICEVVGIYSPPFGEFSEDENLKIIEMVNNSKADILWVSFGCPKQEWWIARNKNALHIPVAAGVGAAFDFHSGNKKRAPLFFQKMRLEWLFRIMQEPTRLWRRYLEGGLHYRKVLIQQKKTQKEAKHEN